MVLVAGRYCVDRYEARLSDQATGKPLSPYYVPSAKAAIGAAKFWKSARLEVGSAKAKAMPLPELFPWESRGEVTPMAVSEAHAVPQGYASGVTAERACKNAGKRLCSLDEWRTACRGERERDFPYGDGDRYVAGKCNVFRDSHPAAVLHGDPSQGHSDPRLNLVRAHDGPLLRKTGTSSECVSVWGEDGIVDMVGNLDEWIDDPEGTFVGGFYARSTKAGCQARIESHSYDYQDYSTGIRCCRDASASDL